MDQELIEVIVGLLKDRLRDQPVEVEYSDVTYDYEIKVGRIGAVEVPGGLAHAFARAGRQPGEGR